MYLPHSDAIFVKDYPAETTEALLDGVAFPACAANLKPGRAASSSSAARPIGTFSSHPYRPSGLLHFRQPSRSASGARHKDVATHAILFIITISASWSIIVENKLVLLIQSFPKLFRLLSN